MPSQSAGSWGHFAQCVFALGKDLFALLPVFAAGPFPIESAEKSPAVIALRAGKAEAFRDAGLVSFEPAKAVTKDAKATWRSNTPSTSRTDRRWKLPSAPRQVWFNHANDLGKSFGDKPREWEMDTVGKLSKGKGDETAIRLEFVKARLRPPKTTGQFMPLVIRPYGNCSCGGAIASS